MQFRAGLAVTAALAVMPASAPAAPADLDPSFGGEGLATALPDAGHGAGELAQGPGGRILAAFTHGNTVRIIGFTSDGQRAKGFGNNGILNTDIPASDALALAGAPGDKLFAGGGAGSATAVTIARFTATGAADPTFGVGGRVTVDLGGALNPSTAAAITGLASLPDGGVVASARQATGLGSGDLVVLRLLQNGQLDPGFGAGGVVRLDTGGSERALDVASLPGGDVLLSGERTAGSATDTVVARLTAGGLPSFAFGGGAGWVRIDAGGGGADRGAALAADGGGGIFVAAEGPAGADRGIVIRLGSGGLVDTAFAGDGILSDALLPQGAGTASALSVALDDAGRVLAGGRFTPAGSDRSRWVVARLEASGPEPRDQGFGTNGSRVLDVCEGRGPVGIRAIGIQSNSRVLLGGPCAAGAPTAGVARLFGRAPLRGLSLSVDSQAEAAGSETTEIRRLPPETAAVHPARLQGTPLRSSPLRSSPLRSSPLRSSPLRSSPLRSSPLRSSGIAEAALLSELPLRSGDWNTYTAPTRYAGAPLYTVTLADLFAVDPPPPGLDSLTLADIALEDSPLRSSSLAALLLDVPIGQLPDPADGDWCSFLAGQPLDCGNGVSLGETSLLDLERAGDDLAAYYAKPIELQDAEIGGTVLAQARLIDVELSATPLGSIPGSEVSALLACGTECGDRTLAQLQAEDPEGFSSGTLGELIALLPVASRATISLGELIPGLLPIEEFPFDDDALPLDQVLALADLRSSDLQTYTVGAAVDCDQLAGLTVRVDAPYGSRVAQGSARLAEDGGTARTIADPRSSTTGGDGAPRRTLLEFDVESAACAGAAAGEIRDVALAFDVEPHARLGPDRAEADAIGELGASGTASDSLVVDDSRDPGDEPGQAREISSDRLYTGYVSTATDIDEFVLDAPPAGSEVTVSLSHLTADFDLRVFGGRPGPDSSPLRSSPLRSSPLRSSTLEDNDERTVSPDTVQELPLRSSPLRSSSITRGTTAERATFRTYESDAGTRLAIEVTGFNGSTSPEPYLLSVRVRSPGPTPECISRQSMSGPSRPFPASVPGDRQTIILVHYGRMVALYGREDTDAMMDSLDTLAARDDVRGVVVPLDEVTDYGAWDADPCSIEAANDVAEQVRDAIDDVTRDLGDLRSIAIVGSDEVIPVPRTPDLVTHSNQADYADELLLNGRDTPISRAFRTAHILTDDFYGDYDPQVGAGGYKFIPDVALGRVIESADDVRRQAEHYEGFIDPQAAAVAGYDFLKDGAEEIATGLSPSVGGNVQRLISEDWTAADGRDALNAPGARFGSLNAHYDHFRALPAAAFRGTSPDLLHASEVQPAPDSLLFTIGCQSGLNVPDQTSSGERAGDWAQTISGRLSLFGGNTGFGYGDTEEVAYSERLASLVAQRLGSRQVTVGQAVMLAKQGFFGELLAPGVYDWKSGMEFQLVGWPMTRVGPSGGSAPSLLPERFGDGEALASDTLTVAPALERRDSERGSLWVAGGEQPIVEHWRPVQPAVRRDVTAGDGLRAHGALVEALEVSRLEGIDPVYSTPTIDLAAHEPEARVREAVFPHALATVGHVATAEGLRDRVTVAAGQFRTDTDRVDGTGSQRLHESIGLRVYRSDSSDFDPPAARFVAGQVAGGTATFQVETTASDVRRALVLFFEEGSGVARTVELQPAGGGVWAGGRALSGGGAVTEFLVQLLDDAGNVGIGSRHLARSVDGCATGPCIAFDPETPASGFHPVNPLISLLRGTAPDTLYTRSVDGGTPVVDDGVPFSVGEPADGLHTIRYVGNRGSTAERPLRIDRLPPLIHARADRPAASGGWWSGPVTVLFSCTDAVAGVTSCGPDRTVSEAGETTVEGRAADAAGNDATAAFEVRIDTGNPAVTIDPPSVLSIEDGLVRARFSGDAEDDRSGVRAVRVTYIALDGSEAGSVSAVVDCTDGGRDCRWEARTPPIPPGLYRVRAQAFDRADRVGAAERTDLVAPSE